MTGVAPGAAPADPIAEALRGFACPYEPMDHTLRQEIVGEYARGYLAAFIERYGPSLGALQTELALAMASDIPYDSAWDIAFGKVRRTLQSDSESPFEAGTAALRRMRGESSIAHGTMMSEHSIRILQGVEAAAVDPFDDGLAPAFSPAVEIEETCRSAIEVLRSHSPRYLTWVDDVIRHVLPRDGSDGFLRSASSMDWPGVVSASFPCNPAALAETFVHEASHQHLNIVRRLGPVVNGEDDGLYYSPIKGIPRPIEAILVAYHAVANMLLFYRDCLESDIHDDGYCEKNLNRHCEDALVLLGHLERSRGLAPSARTIVDASAKHLRARIF